MQDVVGYQSGVLGVVGALCREIDLVDVINEAAEWLAKRRWALVSGSWH